MKLMKSILAVGMMTGGVWAQNPNIINNVQNTMQTVQQQKTTDSNAALGIKPAASAAGASARPAAAQPAPAPGGATAATPAMAKPHAAPTAKRNRPARPVIAAKKDAPPKAPAPVKADPSKNAEATKPGEKKWSMSGKRDPFFSPVVQQSSGSGCSTGKKCLEIGQINVRGVVKSEAGFIAVVTNSLNKAYFLRENDPVFNGFVVRITGDAVVFQETVQDKLGKPETHEVVKRILTPAV